MGTIRRSARAYLDYREIWEYLADNGGEAVADGKLADFDAKLALIAELPHLGRERPELAPDLRSFPVGDYLLYYRPVAEGIELVRVLHGRRDVRQAFRTRRTP